MADVIELHGSPLLNDIPGQLRQMADRIESGEVHAESALFIIDRSEDDDWPGVYGWGEHLGDTGNIGLCELAKAFFVNNTTRRD